MTEIKYPCLAYSELTKRVYIVLSENKKIDVTSQYEHIVKNREQNSESVKRGRWYQAFYSEYEQGMIYRCTQCGEEISRKKEKLLYKYCPHCGADMRKEDNNER